MDGLPPLREEIEAHGISAKKSLGQNFLLDLNITSKIARLAGNLSDVTVIEIGPGPGGLTRGLLMEGAQHVVAFERDQRVAPILNNISAHYPDRLEVRFEDALKADLFDGIEGNVKIISNLPYNIGTELLVKWLCQPWPPRWSSLTLMFQKEVAERITAKPGSKHWGRLAVLANWRSNAKEVYSLAPSAFTPPPIVHSAVVHLEPCQPKIDVDLKSLERVTKAAFGQRRKMLRASLKTLSNDANDLIMSTGIDPTRRAETLSIEEFGALTKQFEI